MALAGPDGKKAEELLRGSVRFGAATLGQLAEAAVTRLMAKDEEHTVEQVGRRLRQMMSWIGQSSALMLSAGIFSPGCTGVRGMR